MVHLLLDLPGTGKSKALVRLIKSALETETGDVVCLAKSKKLNYDIPHKARLISGGDYSFGSYDFLKGFLSGLGAGNYDVTHVFLDSLEKFVEVTDPTALEPFLAWLSDFCKTSGLSITLTLTGDPATTTDAVRAYFPQ